MANLSVLYKLFILCLILKANVLKSFMLPDIYIRLKQGIHLTNSVSRNDTAKLYSTKLANILCPLRAKGLYAYPFDKVGYIVCRHHQTSYENCAHGKVYSLIARKCIPAVKPHNQYHKKFFLYNCPFNDQQKHFYPYNARKYFQCCRGKLTVLNCPSWEMFSIQQRRCMPETQILQNDHVPCSWPAATPPPNHNRNQSSVAVVHNDTIFCPLRLFGLFPHPFSNEKYLKCVEGRLYDKSCGPGFVYNFMSKLCVENSENLFQTLPPFQNNYSSESIVETRLSDNLTFLKCPTGLSGTFAHPFSCFNYIHCSPDGSQVNACSGDKLYSFRENKCEAQSRLDKYDHVPCVGSNEENEEEDSISLGVFCAPTGSMTYPHPQSQYKYVNCNNGQLHVKRCPRNEIFSLDDLECIAEATEMYGENNVE